MTLSAERPAVQSALVRYAAEVGWTYLSADEAFRLRWRKTALDTLFRTLLHHLMTGNVRVAGAIDVGARRDNGTRGITMPYNPEKHHRRSIRLKGYDYTQAWAYFVTIGTQNRECLFGEIVNGQMVLNDAGRMIQTACDAIPEHHQGIKTDAFVIMPNHIHGIIVITDVNASASAGAGSVGASLVPAHMPGATTTGETTTGATTTRATTTGETTNGATTNGATTRVAPTVGDVIGAFKSRTTVEYIRGVATYGWTPFTGKLWQRNYYEHIIRNDESLNRIREYIRNNPTQWEYDREKAKVTLPTRENRDYRDIIEKDR
mgnify:CR=1 FL=1